MKSDAEKIKEYQDIRKRLIYPPNAVYDPGIDLTRKSTAYKGDIPPEGTPPKKALPKPYVEIVLPINFDDILEAVGDFYGLSLDDLRGSNRKTLYVTARKVVVHLSLKLITVRSLSSIARGLDKDHTTIVHARRKVRRDLQENELLRFQVQTIEEAILAKYRDRPPAPTLNQPPLALHSWQGSQVQGVPGVDRSGRGPLASAEARQFAKID